MLQEGVLYRFGQVNRFCQVLQLEQVPTFLQELHGGVARRHFSSDITMKKILDASYWWLMVNRDVHEYCQSCDQCQRIGNIFTYNLAKLVITLPKNHLKNGDWFYWTC